ncbi:MAG TPA: phosphatase PAP2 family protein [Thermoleophilaceae bacterium]|nr:phosphatase PAP2 family protein [Thermoleophilaceae bacterium]
MTEAPATVLGQFVLAHQPGTPAFYWAIASDTFLLLWTTALLLAPRWGRSPIRARWFRLVGLATALSASLVTLAGKTLEVWPGYPLFPSGHTAYVVAIAVFLVARDRRWLRWVIPFVALTAVSLVLSFFHIPIDIVGGTLVGLVVATPAFRWLKRLESRQSETATRAPASVTAAEGLDDQSVGDRRQSAPAGRRPQAAARTAATSSSTEGRSSGPSLR